MMFLGKNDWEENEEECKDFENHGFVLIMGKKVGFVLSLTMLETKDARFDSTNKCRNKR